MRMAPALGALRVPGVILTREERRKLAYAAKEIPKGRGLGGLGSVSMFGNGSAPATFMGGGQNVESILDTDRGLGEMRDGFAIAQLFGRFTGMKDFEKAAKDPSQAKLMRRAQSLAGAVVAVLVRTEPKERVPDLQKLLGTRVTREVMGLSVQLKQMGETDAIGFCLSMVFLSGALDAEQKNPSPYALAYLNTYKQFIDFLDRRKSDPRARKMRVALGAASSSTSTSQPIATSTPTTSSTLRTSTSTSAIDQTIGTIRQTVAPPTFPQPTATGLDVRQAIKYFNDVRGRSATDLQNAYMDDVPAAVIMTGPLAPYAYRFALWAALNYKKQLPGTVSFDIVNSAVATQISDVTATVDQTTTALYDLQRFVANSSGLGDKFKLARGVSELDVLTGKGEGVKIKFLIKEQNAPTLSWILDAKTSRNATLSPDFGDADITLEFPNRGMFLDFVTKPTATPPVTWNTLNKQANGLLISSTLPNAGTIASGTASPEITSILDTLTRDVMMPASKTPPVLRPTVMTTPAITSLTPQQLLEATATPPSTWRGWALPAELVGKITADMQQSSLVFAALCMLWSFEKRYGDIFAETDIGTADRPPKSVGTVDPGLIWAYIFDLTASMCTYFIGTSGQLARYGQTFQTIEEYNRFWPEIKRQAALLRAGKDTPGYKIYLPADAANNFTYEGANVGIKFGSMNKPQRDAARFAGWFVDVFGTKLKPLFVAMGNVSNPPRGNWVEIWRQRLVSATDQCAGAGFTATPFKNLVSSLAYVPAPYSSSDRMSAVDQQYVIEGVAPETREVAQYFRFLVIAVEVARRCAWVNSGVIPNYESSPPVPSGGEAFANADCNLGFDKRENAARKYRADMLREPTFAAINWYAPFLRPYSTKDLEPLRLTGVPPPPDFITPEKSFFEKLASNIEKFFSNAFAFLADAVDSAVNFLCRGLRFLFGDTIGGFLCSVVSVLVKLVVGGIATALAIIKQAVMLLVELIGNLVKGEIMEAVFGLFKRLNTIIFLAIGGPIAYVVDIPLTVSEQDRLKRKAIAAGQDANKVPPSFEELGEKLARSCPMFIVNLAMAIINLILVVGATAVSGGAAEVAGAAASTAATATGAPAGGSPLRTAVGGVISALAPGVAVFVEVPLRSALRGFDITKTYADETFMPSDKFNLATEQLIKLITMVIMGVLGMSDIISQIVEKVKTFVKAKGGVMNVFTDAFKNSKPAGTTVTDIGALVKDVIKTVFKAITSMSLKTIGEALASVGKLLAVILAAFLGIPELPPELLALQSEFQQIYTEGAKTVEQAKKVYEDLAKNLSEADKAKLAMELGLKQDAEAEAAAQAEANRRAEEYLRQMQEMQAAEQAKQQEAQRIANERAALEQENARLRQQLAEQGGGSIVPPATAAKTNTGMILGAAAVAGLAIVMLSGRRT
jgi:hypothetical protein